MRRLTILVALLALAVGAASCTTSPAAATVDGRTITQATLKTQLSDIASSPAAACVFAAEFDPSSASVNGAGQDTVTTAAATAELDNLVIAQLLQADLQRHHRVVTAAAVSSARADLASAVLTSLQGDAQSGSLPPACSTLSGTQNPVAALPAGYGRDVARYLALQEAFRSLVGHVNISEAGIAAYYRTHPSDFRQACLDLVVTDSQAAAQSVASAVAAGESFAAASSGPGADPQITPPGGQLSCVLPNVITSTFGAADAATIYAATSGQLLAPMAWTDPQTGTTYWLVVKVASLHTAPLSQVSSQIRQQLLSGTDASATAALDRLLRRADVQVDPIYGSWQGRIGLTAPKPPPSADVLNPTANQALALRRG